MIEHAVRDNRQGSDSHRRANREYARRNYSKMKAYRDTRKLERSRIINDLKLSSRCVDCGYAEHPAALDFDHRPGTVKSFEISVGIVQHKPWNLVLAEIEKCEVVCANCHRIRTTIRRLA